MAFLDGNQPERLCAPMVDHIEARGGKVHLNSRFREFVLSEDGTKVEGLRMRGGEVVTADEYVSAMPVPGVRGTWRLRAAL